MGLRAELLSQTTPKRLRPVASTQRVDQPTGTVLNANLRRCSVDEDTACSCADSYETAVPSSAAP